MAKKKKEYWYKNFKSGEIVLVVATVERVYDKWIALKVYDPGRKVWREVYTTASRVVKRHP